MKDKSVSGTYKSSETKSNKCSPNKSLALPDAAKQHQRKAHIDELKAAQACDTAEQGFK
jgi:hypothetical protein